MAEALDDGEFWLPSEFLTDDDLLMETHKFQKEKTDSGASKFCFPSEFPYGFSSFRSSSPVESLVSSTETESDEEDYLAGFTRQMAQPLLQQVEDNPKKRVLSGSPESPLCGLGSWSSSSRGSPNGPSHVSSPSSTPLNGKDDAWDLLYAAAGQVARMKLNNEVQVQGPPKYGKGLLGSHQKQVNTPVSQSNVGPYSNKAVLTQHQLQANHLYQLKQQQQQSHDCSFVWGGRQVKPTPTPTPTSHHRQQGVGYGNGSCGGALGLPPSAWPPLQQQHQQQDGSRMRAVFLGGSGARRESSGTGVFLPRRTGNPLEPRRKPACSTALIPARVVQSLNLNFDALNGCVSQPRFIEGFGGSGHHGQGGHGNVILSQHQQQQRKSARSQPAIINTELQLPQEWTY